MRIFSRLALALLAVLFAWRLGPALITLLIAAFPFFGEFVKWLLPNGGGRSAADWFEFVVAIFLFWILFKVTGFAFGFLAPQAQFFGTTKAVRRFQGFCGELFIIFGLFIGVTMLDAMMRNPPPQAEPAQPTIEQPKSDPLKDRTVIESPKPAEVEAPPSENSNPFKPRTGETYAEWTARWPPDLKTHEEWDDAWREGHPDLPKPMSDYAFAAPDRGETFEHWMARRPSGKPWEDWKHTWDETMRFRGLIK